MRFIVSLCVVAVSIAGAALAQEEGSQQPFRAAFDMQPSGQDFARNYPRDAFEHGIQGLTVLCCAVNEDRTLDCSTRLEWPEGQGFGEASEVVAREFRMNEDSYAEYLTTPREPMKRLIVWQIAGGNTHNLDRVRRVISENGEDLCRAQSAPIG